MVDKKEETKTEEFKTTGKSVVKKVKEIIKEGNARRIIIKNEDGKKILEFPVTIGVVGTLVAPYLAALGTLVAILTSCTIVVERKK